jgi:hypothetical protein
VWVFRHGPGNRWLRRCAALVTCSVALGVVAFGALQIRKHQLPYEADGAVVFLSPARQTVNPYSYFPKSLIATAAAVVERVDQPGVRSRMVSAGGGARYTVTLSNTGSQWVPLYRRPTVTIVATAQSATAAQHVRDGVLHEIRTQLADLQDELSSREADRIGVQVIAAPDASRLHGRPSRAVLAFLVLAAWIVGLAVRLARTTSRARRVAPSQESSDRSAVRVRVT